MVAEIVLPLPAAAALTACDDSAWIAELVRGGYHVVFSEHEGERCYVSAHETEAEAFAARGDDATLSVASPVVVESPVAANVDDLTF